MPFRSGRLSAGARVALAIIAGVVVAVALLNYVSYRMFTSQVTADLDSTLLSESEAYAAAVGTAMSQGPEDLASASETYLSERGSSGTLMLVRLADGRVFPQQGSPLLSVAGNEMRLDPQQRIRSFDDIELKGEKYRLVTYYLEYEDPPEVAGVFQAALPLAPAERTIRDMQNALVRATLIAIAFAVLLSGWVARAALRPLRSAARTAGRIDYSSLSERVPHDGPDDDDVGLLVNSLNGMLDRLESAFAEQRRFIADASHEMRTPLTIARGHLDVMRAEGNLSLDQDETLELVNEELKRTSDLVSDLLSLARLEVGGPPPLRILDLAQVVEEAVARAQGLGDRRFVLEYGGPLMVRGNRDLLLQTLLNLLSNAVGHTEDGGRIDVECGVRGGRAEVSVADNGPGIRPEELERVFDRFYRSPGRPRPGGGGGSGLGLAIARRLAQLHGGELTAGNHPEGGAVFYLRLPLEGH